MRRTSLVIEVVALAVAVSPWVWGQGEREGRPREAAPAAAREGQAGVREGGGREGGRDMGGREDRLPWELADVAAELNLTPAQQAQITEKAKALRTALAEWDQANQEKIAKMRADLQATLQGADRDAARKGMEPIRLLQAERGKIETSGRNLIMEILTPEQRQAYGGIKMLQDHDFAAMLKETKPTPEQAAQIQEKARALGAALAKWDLENGDKLQKLQQQIEEALAAMQPLREQRDKLIADQKAAALAVLTPEQKTALAAAALREQVAGPFLRMGLTPEQIAKVNTLCEQAVKDAGPALETDRKVAEEARSKSYKAIREQVLTDAQRAQLQAAPGR